MWSLDARTQTIVCWTGISRYRISTLHQQHRHENFGEYRRHRGVPPYQLATFFRNRAIKRETVTLAGLFRQVELIPVDTPPGPAQKFPNLRRCELLCTAYEIFRTLVPDSSLTIDHAALLAISLARADEIRLVRCVDCKGAMVADLFSAQTHCCVYCDEDPKDEPLADRLMLSPHGSQKPRPGGLGG